MYGGDPYGGDHGASQFAGGGFMPTTPGPTFGPGGGGSSFSPSAGGGKACTKRHLLICSDFFLTCRMPLPE